MAGEHAGHRQRMRERFLTNGLEGFAPHEVLELMLFYAIPQRNVNPLAHSLLERFGSLRAVLDAPVEELRKVEGMGEYAAALLSLFSQVAARLERREEKHTAFANRGEAQRYCGRLLKGQRVEQFYIICLNAQNQVIKDVLVSSGTINEVQTYPRVVVEAALRHNAHAVILCHNHPGGSCIPSSQDVDVTRVLAELFARLGIVLVDHIIVTDEETLSMVNCGLIVFETGKDADIPFKVADGQGELLIRARLEKLEAQKRQKA